MVQKLEYTLSEKWSKDQGDLSCERERSCLQVFKVPRETMAEVRILSDISGLLRKGHVAVTGHALAEAR